MDTGITAAAIRVLASPTAAAEWLIAPAWGLGGKTPLDTARTCAGQEAVRQLLGRIEYNIPS